jgi:hypothetical protein
MIILKYIFISRSRTIAISNNYISILINYTSMSFFIWSSKSNLSSFFSPNILKLTIYLKISDTLCYLIH